MIAAILATTAMSDTWRSELYPENWTPEWRDSEGRFLHDFSYAGYAMGERPVPDPDGPIRDVTDFGATPEDDTDDTEAIQAAIDAGGVVFFPEGEYRVSSGLEVRQDGTVLRGEGPHKSRILNTSVEMRGQNVLGFFGTDWAGTDDHSLLVADSQVGFTVRVADPERFDVGDTVLVRSELTPEFIAERGMTGWWRPGSVPGPRFERVIVAIDGDELTFDAPLKHELLVRDAAKVVPHPEPLQNVGIEHIGIANVSHPGEGWDEEDYHDPANGAHDAHASHLVRFRGVRDGWVRNVRTFFPEGNRDGVHLLSNGFVIGDSRRITIADSYVGRPQFRGGGGNGYGFTLNGNDSLLERCWGHANRHTFSFKTMFASGNVVLDGLSHKPKYAVDFHMWNSFANLFDGLRLDEDYLDATVRPWGGQDRHGITTTESVLWNTQSLAAISEDSHMSYLRSNPRLVLSQQWGWGYVIGTSGVTTDVITEPTVVHDIETAPADWVEGVGQGGGLQPQSLYRDQLARRLGR